MKTLSNTTQGGNSQNDAKKSAPHSRSTFHPSYRNFQTMRFGEVTPFFVMESVPGDTILLNSKHLVRSLSLKSPLLSKIGIKKDYFSVPYECILPLNWSKIYTNPVSGDDVPQDANCVIPSEFFIDFLRLPALWLEMISSKTSFVVGDFHYLFRSLVTSQLLWSKGSLWRTLGYSSDWFASAANNSSKDVWALSDAFLKSVYNYFVTNKSRFIFVFNRSVDAPLDADSFTLTFDFGNSDNPHSLFNYMLEVFQRYPNFSVEYANNVSLSDIISSDAFQAVLNVGYPVVPSDFVCNLSRLFAYQIVIASLYSNDKVDYVYSAELFRQSIASILGVSERNSSFSYNGLSIPYDVLSFGCLQNFSQLFDGVSDDLTTSDFIVFCALFGYGQSLKYADYFVGSRPTPLAVGDNGVAVIDNSVSVIDTTKALALQRFRNQIARIGRKTEDYLRGLFGTNPSTPLTEPIFLAHTTDTIQGYENENTGDAQMTDANSVTSVLRGSGEKYVFEFHSERPCILLGLASFDVRRAYPNMFSRFNAVADRFDMFNPYLQYIGDQDIQTYEYDTNLAAFEGSLVPFAYTLRDMQYKQRNDEVSGGFISGALPSWTFLDYNSSRNFNDANLPVVQHIGPDFIRQDNQEFDKFYLSLTGLGYSQYFHFIVVSDNQVTAIRPMAYAPSIL